MARRLRRSNGAGTISKLSREGLRCPWNVKVTVGFELDNQGKRKQKRKSLGYFETEEEAIIALAHYCEELKENGGVLPDTGIRTKIKEIWDDFAKEECGKNISDSRRKAYDYTWKRLSEKIQNASFNTLDYKTWADYFEHLRDVEKVGYSTLKRIRGDVGRMYAYANKRGIKVENYPLMFSLGKSPKKGKTLVFYLDDIRTLWRMYESKAGNAEAQFTVKVVLMLIYNGCRIEEFLSLKNQDVHMSEHYFVIPDAKTPAGVRRIPIHKSVYPIYQEFFSETNEYFLTNPKRNNKYSYANFRDSYWDQLREELNWNKDLTPHNCRKTFASYMKYYHLDATCQKLIFGHSGALSLMESTYTMTTLEQLQNEMSKIPEPMKLADLKDETI